MDRLEPDVPVARVPIVDLGGSSLFWWRVPFRDGDARAQPTARTTTGAIAAGARRASTSLRRLRPQPDERDHREQPGSVRNATTTLRSHDEREQHDGCDYPQRERSQHYRTRACEGGRIRGRHIAAGTAERVVAARATGSSAGELLP